MNPVVESVPVGAAVDLSLIGLFLQADLVVKLVMVLLLLASVWVWGIVIDKVLTLRRANAQADAFEDEFWSGANLEEFFEKVGSRPEHPMAVVFSAAMREWRRSTRGTEPGLRMGLKERVERAMSVAIQREMERMERWMVFLASTGSVAPFVGLFGTVWGIMNSFTAIAAMKNTNLTVVAPGIAEALFATAIGLFAAIPAVLAYNKLTTDLGRFAGRLDGFATEFGAILSRSAEERP